MEDFWARYIDPSGQPGPDYWTYCAARLAELAAIPEGAAVLDIGTYDGNVLVKAMNKAGVRGRGVGVDIDSDGLRDGVTEALARGWGNVTYAQMDAAYLGFPSATYDSVLANFVGWDYCYDFERMEFTAPDSRMAEIRRVLKPGGQVGLGFWIEQADLDWMAGAFQRYLPQGEGATGKRITPYGKENPEGYEAILHYSGFHDISIHVETTNFATRDTTMWWRQMKQAVHEYFEEMPELERFKEQVFAVLKPFQSPKGIHFDKTVAYAFGAKR